MEKTAASWTMVKDNVTGLIWEVKTDDGTIHDKDNRYTWYDSNPETNGGNAGTEDNGTNSNTESFISSLNTSAFGGYSDWRLPTDKELQTIVDYGEVRPAIDKGYFPKTMVVETSHALSLRVLVILLQSIVGCVEAEMGVNSDVPANVQDKITLSYTISERNPTNCHPPF